MDKKRLKNFWLTEAECSALEARALESGLSQARVVGGLILGEPMSPENQLTGLGRAAESQPQGLAASLAKAAELRKQTAPRTQVDPDKIAEAQKWLTKKK